MENQAFFSLKDKGKKLRCRLLQFLFGALRVKKCWDKLSYMFFMCHFLTCQSIGNGISM